MTKQTELQAPHLFLQMEMGLVGRVVLLCKNYNLQLDSEFIETMIENGWEIPISEKELDYSDILLDGMSL